MYCNADFQNSMIKIADYPDVTKWSEFAYNHEHGNIFQKISPLLIHGVHKVVESLDDMGTLSQYP